MEITTSANAGPHTNEGYCAVLNDWESRGIHRTICPAAPYTGLWERTFPVTDEMLASAPLYNDQFLWHRFSFEILPHNHGNKALRKFDETEKSTLVLFHHDQKDAIHALFAKLCDMYEAFITNYCKYFPVDGVMFHDDWGSQRSLLISPKMWRQYFKPLYQQYIDIAHSHGKKISMHSDGYTLDIIPDLIEMGLDALNTQIFCIGVDKLAPFKGKITFWGEICRQHLLPYGTVEEVKSAVRQVYDTLWDNGGCIAQCEFGAGAKPENVAAVFETWDELTGK